MPEKDPNVWALISSVFDATQVFVYAALVAAVRILLDEKEKIWKRIALEMILCGLLAQGADELVQFAFGWEMPVAIAAAVGLVGPTYLRVKLKHIVNSKTDSTGT